ncbi:MAG: hypothetical protein GXP42_04225 [Chloroflexi bacterium]|nr:hypothetical protein [Chloroflexota bacterium]
MFPHFGAPRETARSLLLLLLLAIPVWAPLTRPGAPVTLAGPTPALRLAALENGRPPVVAEASNSWRNDGPWPYAAARVWRWLGGDLPDAIKWSQGLALLGLALGLWGWARRWAGAAAGPLAALLVLYAPLLLSAVYQQGALAATWVVAGMALAGWGLLEAGWRGGLLAGLGALIALASSPGLGLAAAFALFALALARLIAARAPRSAPSAMRDPQEPAPLVAWPSTLLLAMGAGLGFVLAGPWSSALTPPFTLHIQGPALYQFIEPGWPFDTTVLSRETPLSFSLGLPLLALFLIAFWLWAGHSSPETQNKGMASRALLYAHFLIPVLLLVLAISSPPPLSFLSPHLPLLSLPFMGVAAVVALRLLPALRRPAIYAALLILPLASAGPGLSPTFEPLEVPSQPIAIFGDNQIVLLDLDVEGTLEAGATITVNARWFAPRAVDFDYNVFVQVLDANQTVRAQVDAQPQNGARPMTSWRPGEIISDQYTLTIPSDAPADLQLILGAYDWRTLERLPVGDQNAIRIPIAE